MDSDEIHAFLTLVGKNSTYYMALRDYPQRVLADLGITIPESRLPLPGTLPPQSEILARLDELSRIFADLPAPLNDIVICWLGI